MWKLWIIAAVAITLLLLKGHHLLVSVWRSGKHERYTDEASGDSKASVGDDAAYEQLEEERKNAQSMAEDRTAMWP